MKLEGYVKRLEAHESLMKSLEDSGEMAEIYKYNPKRFKQLHQRLGYLNQKVESLRLNEISALNNRLNELYDQPRVKFGTLIIGNPN